MDKTDWSKSRGFIGWTAPKNSEIVACDDSLVLAP
jgi:hypothetical protein